MDPEAIAAGKQLKVIARAGVGLDKLPAGWVSGRVKTLAVLREAQAARASVEMNFLPEDMTRRPVRCSFADVDREKLLLEITSAARISTSWIGREVSCFFRYTARDKKLRFFTFTSSIVGVKKQPNLLHNVILETPKKLERNQKRAWIRLEPPSQYVLGVAMWPQLPKKKDHRAISLKQWGRPLLAYVPGSSTNPLILDNLSAGGLALLLLHSRIKDAWHGFFLSQKLYLLLELYDPDSSKRLRFWLETKVRNLLKNPETHDIKLGLEITAWGRLFKEEGYKLKWTDTGGHGVDQLAAWAMKRHLELYREKGIE